MPNTPKKALRAAKPQPLWDRVLAETMRLVADHGLGSLKIRDVATAAGCSVGSVYNAFEDQDALVIAVNRDTLLRLDGFLDKATAKSQPDRVLHDLADAYLSFATDDVRRLRALFEHRMRDGRSFPREHLDLVDMTFSRIAGRLTRLLPDLASNEIALLSRTLFSAVHGVIALGLEERIVAVPVKDLRRQVGLFVDAFEAGLGAYGAR